LRGPTSKGGYGKGGGREERRVGGGEEREGRTIPALSFLHFEPRAYRHLSWCPIVNLSGTLEGAMVRSQGD